MRLYFTEIKNRFILINIVQISSFISLCYYKNLLLFHIVYPVIKLEASALYYFIFTNITEPLIVYLNLIFFFNIQIVLLYFIYHCVIFLSPAFNRLEFLLVLSLKRRVTRFWMLSLVLHYFFVLPLSWFFYLDLYTTGYGISFNIYFEAKLAEYFNYYLLSYVTTFAYFQFLSVLFLIVDQLTNKKDLKKSRKIFYLSLLFISMLISDDIFIFLLVIWFLICSYETLFLKKFLDFRR